MVQGGVLHHELSNILHALRFGSMICAPPPLPASPYASLHPPPSLPPPMPRYPPPSLPPPMPCYSPPPPPPPAPGLPVYNASNALTLCHNSGPKPIGSWDLLLPPLNQDPPRFLVCTCKRHLCPTSRQGPQRKCLTYGAWGAKIHRCRFAKKTIGPMSFYMPTPPLSFPHTTTATTTKIISAETPCLTFKMVRVIASLHSGRIMVSNLSSCLTMTSSCPVVQCHRFGPWQAAFQPVGHALTAACARQAAELSQQLNAPQWEWCNPRACHSTDCRRCTSLPPVPAHERRPSA